MAAIQLPAVPAGGPTLRGVFRPLLLSNFFGISFKTTRNEKNKTCDFILFLFCLALVILNVYIITSGDDLDFQADADNFLQICSFLKNTFNNVCYVSIVIICFIRRNNYIIILQDFLHLEHLYRRHKVRVSYMNLRLVIFLVISTAVLLNILQLAALWWLTGNASSAWCYFAFYCLPSNACQLYSLQLLACVFLIKTFLRKLMMQFGGLHVKLSISAHRRLFDLSVRINDAFASPILFCVVNSFVAVFSLLFFAWHGFSLEGKVYEFSDCCGFIVVSVLQSSMPLLVLCCFCESTIAEDEKIRCIVHEAAKNEEQVQFWNEKLMHEHIQFHAGGFFNINCALIKTVFGAVCIYLVIIIQFDNAAHQRINKLLAFSSNSTEL